MSEVPSPAREGAPTSAPWPRIVRAALLGLIAALAAGVITQFLPRVYRAGVKILPSDATAVLPFADLLATADLSAVLGARGASQNPVLTYPEILLSRPVLEGTLTLRLDSLSHGQARTVLEALRIKGKTSPIQYDRGIKKLRKSVAVRPNVRTGIIALTVDTHDPDLSAFVANGLVDNLNQFNLGVRESRSRAVREFIEERLRETSAMLERSEQTLARFRESNLRIGNSPQLLLQQEQLQRQVNLQTELYHLLRRQYEQARIEEQRDTPTFTVIEEALPPVKRYRPNTILNMLSAGAVCVVVVLGMGMVRPMSLRGGAGARRANEVTGGP